MHDVVGQSYGGAIPNSQGREPKDSSAKKGSLGEGTARTQAEGGIGAVSDETEAACGETREIRNA